jgi:hypothetical protein
MTGTPGRGAATYELVVAGDLGPVLRHALAPYASAHCEHHTVLRTVVGEDSDLVDLVLMLASRGLEISDVLDLG